MKDEKTLTFFFKSEIIIVQYEQMLEFSMIFESRLCLDENFVP
jgi:hypothetical protein